MNLKSLVLNLALLALLLPMASQAENRGKCGTMCKDMCPMMVEGADVKVADTAEGVVITITAKDPVVIKNVQESAKKCQNCKTNCAAKTDETVVCPVMNRTISKSKAAAVREYKGKKYYLCCQQCVDAFDKNPEKYAK